MMEMGWRSSYHRISDDSVSSYGGHPTKAAAIREAIQNLSDPDIDHTWVRNPEEWVIWDSAYKGKPYD